MPRRTRGRGDENVRFHNYYLIPVSNLDEMQFVVRPQHMSDGPADGQIRSLGTIHRHYHVMRRRLQHYFHHKKAQANLSLFGLNLVHVRSEKTSEVNVYLAT